VISDFSSEVVELPTFRYKLSVPSSRIYDSPLRKKNQKSQFLKKGVSLAPAGI
jgi:hypothetical protein